MSNHHKNGKIFVILDEKNLEVSKLLFAQKTSGIFFNENNQETNKKTSRSSKKSEETTKMHKPAVHGWAV